MRCTQRIAFNNSYLNILSAYSSDPVPDNLIAVRDFTTNTIEILWAQIDGTTGYFVFIWPVGSPRPDGDFRITDPARSTAVELLTTVSNSNQMLEAGQLYNIAVRPVPVDNVRELPTILQRTSMCISAILSNNAVSANYKT